VKRRDVFIAYWMVDDLKHVRRNIESCAKRSVQLSDIQSECSPAKNFHERHGRRIIITIIVQQMQLNNENDSYAALMTTVLMTLIESIKRRKIDGYNKGSRLLLE